MGRLQKKKTVAQKEKLKAKKQLVEENGDSSDVAKKPVNKNFASAAKVAAEKANKEPGLVEKCRSFLNEVNAELKKVVWPQKNQTIASTAVVIVLVIIVSSFLGLFDVGLRSLISMVLH